MKIQIEKLNEEIFGEREIGKERDFQILQSAKIVMVHPKYEIILVLSYCLFFQYGDGKNGESDSWKSENYMGVILKRSHEPMYRQNTKNRAKRFRATTIQSWESDNLMGSKSDKSNTAIAIFKE